MLVRCFFGLNDILPEEEVVLRQFFKGCNTYFSAPTWFGKSLIFQAIPIIAYVILNQAPGTAILLVICPLLSLMNDQTARLKDTGTLNPAAVYSGQDDQMLKDIKEGYKNIVFILPESVMTGDRWRKMLSSETFQANCVGVAVDEAHCISTW